VAAAPGQVEVSQCPAQGVLFQASGQPAHQGRPEYGNQEARQAEEHEHAREAAGGQQPREEQRSAARGNDQIVPRQEQAEEGREEQATGQVGDLGHGHQPADLGGRGVEDIPGVEDDAEACQSAG